jgi:hypothetical protein
MFNQRLCVLIGCIHVIVLLIIYSPCICCFEILSFWWVFLCKYYFPERNKRSPQTSIRVSTVINPPISGTIIQYNFTSHNYFKWHYCVYYQPLGATNSLMRKWPGMLFHAVLQSFTDISEEIMSPFSGWKCKSRGRTSRQTRKHGSSKQSKYTLLFCLLVLLTLTLKTEAVYLLELR